MLTRLLLINPRFPESFWSFRWAIDSVLSNKRTVNPPLGLATVGGSMAFFILLLDIAMPAWLAALIVTVVYGAVAGILALSGKERMSRATPPTPQRTITSVKEDVQWAKSHATSNSK